MNFLLVSPQAWGQSLTAHFLADWSLIIRVGAGVLWRRFSGTATSSECNCAVGTSTGTERSFQHNPGLKRDLQA